MSVDGVLEAVVLSRKIDEFVENNREGLFNSVICKKKDQKKDFFVEKERDFSIKRESASTVFPSPLRKACYYEQVRDRIDALFEKGERESLLESLMPESRWVKIHKTATQYYVVGIIGRKSMPDYMCYGLPSDFSMIPPSSLGKDARWLPLDVKNPQGKGYWLLFQSAKTGETVGSD
jgi:hypothetical protein